VRDKFNRLRKVEDRVGVEGWTRQVRLVIPSAGESIAAACKRMGVRGKRGDITLVFNINNERETMSSEKIENKLRTLRLNIKKEVEKLSGQGYTGQDLTREAGLPVEYLPEPEDTKDKTA
jgi:hypothetical protein